MHSCLDGFSDYFTLRRPVLDIDVDTFMATKFSEMGEFIYNPHFRDSVLKCQLTVLFNCKMEAKLAVKYMAYYLFQRTVFKMNQRTQGVK